MFALCMDCCEIRIYFEREKKAMLLRNVEPFSKVEREGRRPEEIDPSGRHFVQVSMAVGILAMRTSSISSHVAS